MRSLRNAGKNSGLRPRSDLSKSRATEVRSRRFSDSRPLWSVLQSRADRSPYVLAAPLPADSFLAVGASYSFFIANLVSGPRTCSCSCGRCSLQMACICVLRLIEPDHPPNVPARFLIPTPSTRDWSISCAFQQRGSSSNDGRKPLLSLAQSILIDPAEFAAGTGRPRQRAGGQPMINSRTSRNFRFQHA